MGWALGMLAFDAVLYIAILLYADYAEEKASKAKSAGERKNHPIKLLEETQQNYHQLLMSMLPPIKLSTDVG
jgi:hypothetical protein